MPGWKVMSSQVVYESPWLKVMRDDVLDHKGQPLIYSYMRLQNPSTFIVACNDTGDILLQQVYRYPIDERLWEIPAGYMEKDEEPLAAAQRELMEETGFVSDDWHRLGRIYQITGTGDVPVEVFLARGASTRKKATDKNEDIINRRFSKIEEIEKMIAQGDLKDSPVIAAIYMAKNYGLQKESI
jgi:8-oxo-dGDP phosphatase